MLKVDICNMNECLLTNYVSIAECIIFGHMINTQLGYKILQRFNKTFFQNVISITNVLFITFFDVFAF